MSEEEDFRKQLYRSLEEVIFNEDDFEELRRAIADLSLGQLSSKELREKIVNFRIRILEALLELFPFYATQHRKNFSIRQFAEEPANSEILEELKEKDEFLEKIGYRINNIYNKLKEKAEG